MFTDSRITKDTYYKGKHRARLANQADSWAIICKEIGETLLELIVYWMPSHTDIDHQKQVAPSWMKDWHVQRIKEAD